MGIFEGINKTRPLQPDQYEKSLLNMTHCGEGEFYKVENILNHLARKLRTIGIEHIYSCNSLRNVPYITFYSQRKKVNVCWFAGSETRDFRGFKIFWKPSESETKQRKRKFPVCAYSGSVVWKKGDEDPRRQIIKATSSLIKFIQETDFSAISE